MAISAMKTSNFRVGGIITSEDPKIADIGVTTPLKDKENCEPPSLSAIKPVNDLDSTLNLLDKNQTSFQQ